MIYNLQINIPAGEADLEKALKKACAVKLKVDISEISFVRILKISLDARPKIPCRQVAVEVYTSPDVYREPAFDFSFPLHGKKTKTVVVAGMGPAGLFAALALAGAGVHVVVLERGRKVEDRRKDIGLLGREGRLDPDSNYAYGEGGAGCFSDGKLYTRSNKRGDVGRVLRTFVHFGADPAIVCQAHPHLGSDRMPKMIASMRKALLDAGSEIHFETRLEKILCDKKGRFCAAVDAQGNEYRADALVLATGNSAEEMYRWMDGEGLLLEEKPFAIGVRLEHPQSLINHLQYKGAEAHYALPPAEYGYAEQVDAGGGLSVGAFSFCMCPGGVVIPAATLPGGLVVNGMSNSGRSSAWANAGWVAAVNRDILSAEGYRLGTGPLSLLDFRQGLERKFFEAGPHGAFEAPAQRMTDFVQGSLSRDLPRCSYSRGVFSAPMRELLPRYISSALRQAFLQVDRKKKGFLTREAVLLGLESRTSSPVRIPRDADTLQHSQMGGMYPCGEGAGYAGGITSSAIDGLNCAEKILESMGLVCNFAMPIRSGKL